MRYHEKTVKAVRSTEARSISKWQSQGWELIGRDASTLHTTLHFRKPLPTVSKGQLTAGAGAMAVLLLVVGIAAAVEGGDKPKPTPRADAAATPQPSSPSESSPEVVKATEAVETPAAAPSRPSANGQPPEAPDGPVVDTTVDALVNRINTDSRGMKAGDRYRLTGELMESRLWYVGAAGDYTVMLKAQGGKQDLQIFVDRALTRGWRDGTRVELLLKNVERTIDGETTDDWLLVKAARVVSP